MTKEELEKLKQTIDYFGHWYDAIIENYCATIQLSIARHIGWKRLGEEVEK